MHSASILKYIMPQGIKLRQMTYFVLTMHFRNKPSADDVPLEWTKGDGLHAGAHHVFV